MIRSLKLIRKSKKLEKCKSKPKMSLRVDHLKVSKKVLPIKMRSIKRIKRSLSTKLRIPANALFSENPKSNICLNLLNLLGIFII